MREIRANPARWASDTLTIEGVFDRAVAQVSADDGEIYHYYLRDTASDGLLVETARAFPTRGVHVRLSGTIEVDKYGQVVFIERTRTPATFAAPETPVKTMPMWPAGLLAGAASGLGAYLIVLRIRRSRIQALNVLAVGTTTVDREPAGAQLRMPSSAVPTRMHGSISEVVPGGPTTANQLTDFMPRSQP